MKYVGTRDLDWSKNGRGNYWSDNPSFDLNGDGIADGPYRPNDLIDTVLWTAPLAKVLTNSPAVQIIRWAQSQFPAILPGGVVDSRPLMTPPRRASQRGLTMTATIEVAGLTKRYGHVEAVRDVCFDLEPGEIIALVGHNGAGKTTLLKLLLGLVPSFGGVNTRARRKSGSRRVRCPAEARLFARECIFQSSTDGARAPFLLREAQGPAGSVALELLDRVGLGSASSRRLGTYSKGMRQRLGLAQALIGEPQVLLLDEPTTGLDPALRLDFYDIVEARRAAGATVVLSSHALAELGDSAGRIIIMNRGKMVANGIDRLSAPSCAPSRQNPLQGRRCQRRNPFQ